MGIGGLVGAAVMACRSTLKVEDVLDEHKEKVDKIGNVWQHVQDGDIPLEKYSEKDHQKDLAVAYTQTTVNFIKLYGPAVTLGAASIFCLISSHGIMQKRSAALVAAYKAVEEGFKAYRKRVVEEYGEETDYMFKNGLRKEEIIEQEIDPETGKKHNVKKQQYVAVNPNGGPSVYAKYFDESCTQWTKDPDYNLMYIKGVQDYYNKMLMAKNHVFLNEIYDALGIERTQAGAVVGWVLSNEPGHDNHIDFGIYDQNKPGALAERARAFVNGNERSILLDFNVDGVIQQLFTNKKV
jgi:hypothetical protein